MKASEMHCDSDLCYFEIKGPEFGVPLSKFVSQLCVESVTSEL